MLTVLPAENITPIISPAVSPCVRTLASEGNWDLLVISSAEQRSIHWMSEAFCFLLSAFNNMQSFFTGVFLNALEAGVCYQGFIEPWHNNSIDKKDPNQNLLSLLNCFLIIKPILFWVRKKKVCSQYMLWYWKDPVFAVVVNLRALKGDSNGDQPLYHWHRFRLVVPNFYCPDSFFLLNIFLINYLI